MSSNEERLNFQEVLAAATRTVSEQYRKEGVSVRDIKLERIFTTSSDDLWDAVTNPKRLKRFFSPVSGDLEFGGHYQVEGNAGGTITECTPGKSFAATWEFGGEVSWIEVLVKQLEGERSSLTLTHITPINDHWKTYGPGAGGVGWDLTFLGLDAYLVDEDFNLSDGEALMASKEGKAFMAGASKAWGKAAIEAGEVPAQAEAAANRTTAFYTGEESQEG